MTRFFLIIAAVATGAVAAAAEAAPTLRANVVVTGPAIRLGDLFSDTGELAVLEVAPSPALGAKTIFDAAWLAARAHEQKLDWQPKSRYDQTVVERASQAISSEAVVAELTHELANRLPVGRIELVLDTVDFHLFVPAGTTPAIIVDALAYDARSGRLSAYVAASAADTTTERVRITGRVHRILDLPVLSRPVAPGEAITARDIETIALHSDRLSQTFVSDAAELIGKTPKRSIRPGEPVRPSDLQTPVVIHKGELVTIVLQDGTLFLTAQGKALEDGAQGQAIHVSNTRSGKMLDATVTGPGAVALSILPGSSPPRATMTSSNALASPASRVSVRKE
jgi:flagella basal body P-ring formation protein FlgA